MNDITIHTHEYVGQVVRYIATIPDVCDTDERGDEHVGDVRGVIVMAATGRFITAYIGDGDEAETIDVDADEAQAAVARYVAIHGDAANIGGAEQEADADADYYARRAAEGEADISNREG